MRLRTLGTIFLFAALVSLHFGTSASLYAAERDNELTAQQLRQAIQTGERLESSRQWLDAIDHYESVSKQWPANADLKYGLRRARFQFAIERRYSDRSFKEALLLDSQNEALGLFDAVLTHVREHYVNDVSSTSFVAHGTESLWLALNNPKFLQTHGLQAGSNGVQRLRDILRYEYWNKPLASPNLARQTVARVAGIAQSVLGLNPTAVVMEYVFGGCNSLDDYSGFLTPDRLNDLYDNIDGQFVGIGIEMKAEDGKGLHLLKVLPDSPAAQGGLFPEDFIVSIDGRDCRSMTTDEAASQLRGLTGSRVRLGVRNPVTDEIREVTLVRRAVVVKSIPIAAMVDRENGIGYIKLTGFQKTSAEELDAALRQLQSQGMRALIWDVRGNPGGLLTAAVEVLDRFLDHGVLVSTRGRTLDQNWTYNAKRMGTRTMPLALLIDDNSASASEIVAGAIKDHHRGTVIGRKSFGKWSVQSIFSLPGSTGLRLTTAKFYSPKGGNYSHVGIEPNLSVEPSKRHTVAYRSSTRPDFSEDADIQKGLDVLRRQLSR